MKSILFTIISLIIFKCAISQTAVNDTIYDKNGVIYSLTIWKNVMESITKSELKAKWVNPKVVKNYLKIEAELEAAINQFSFELNRKGCLVSKFNQIDDAFKNGKRKTQKYKKPAITTFAKQINNYIEECSKFAKNPFYTNDNVEKTFFTDVVGAIDPVALLSAGWTAYKDSKDLQNNKIDKLTGLLNSLKLSGINDLLGKN